ncbi:hypothetical protein [Arcobacter sp. LA11]|uniref:hypothetical protein n=1 Tax=Arcobacter sp. LA11 TaxID=1898176 RepID=UPI00093380D0|nr:hypothetical protein [Arcobacter sp. LA11]
MKKLISTMLLGTFLFTSSAMAGQKEGLNVVLTSGDTQTQMMAMVLSMMTVKAKKKVNITMCAAGGELALKETKTPVFEPAKKSPTMLLNALIKKGVNVQVCPLYLPSVNKDKSALIDGITIAKPPKIAAQLLNDEYTTLSY